MLIVFENGYPAATVRVEAHQKLVPTVFTHWCGTRCTPRT